MKVALSLVALLGTVLRSAAQDLAAPWARLPAQEFFVPMPEEQIFSDTFERINSGARAPVFTMLSITISVSDTVIIYDHHEDGGFEGDLDNLSQNYTEVWGDGNVTNGCAPRPDDEAPCTQDGDDVLEAGSAIVIENAVPIPRGNDKLYDGGDRILSNYPVAVTRAAYPRIPGSLMAGGVEVLDTSMWGMEFTAPVGENQSNEFGGFEYVSMYIMARLDDTVVTKNGGSEVILNMGESHIFSVNQNDKINATKAVQVDLITGDIGSTYELRWYSLLPTTKWTSDYLASVGDTTGETKVVMYSETEQTITYSMWISGPEGLELQNTTQVVPAGQSEWSGIIPDGTGCYLTGTSPFFVMSLTDTLGSGQIQDWGYPVMPVEHLTPQVLIGLGFGCTQNVCSGNHSRERSVVWVAPMEEADFYVDYENDDNIDANFTSIKPYQHVVINDEEDRDMSGAMIYAVKAGEDFLTGPKVNFAAAWGQKANYSYSGDDYALDLGTVVVPSPAVLVSKTAELVDPDNDPDGKFSLGDKIRYNIKIMNMGQADVADGKLTIIDDGLSNNVAYVPNSAVYKGEAGQGYTTLQNENDNTAFPLDGDGVTNPYVISSRGGTHVISFEAVIATNRDAFTSDDSALTGVLINTGVLKQEYMPDKPFENTIEINLTTPPEPAETAAVCVGLFEGGSVYCDNTGHKCDEINGHAYWRVAKRDDCDNSKCVAESDLQFMLEEGYQCGPCD